MPIYEYECVACKARLEVFAGMNDAPPAACEVCGKTELRKVLFSPSIHYKGTGFYSTDYGKKGAGAASTGSSSGSSSGGSDSGSGGSDSGSGSSSDSKPAKDSGSGSSSSGDSSGSKSSDSGSSSSSSGAGPASS